MLLFVCVCEQGVAFWTIFDPSAHEGQGCIRYAARSDFDTPPPGEWLTVYDNYDGESGDVPVQADDEERAAAPVVMIHDKVSACTLWCGV